MEDFIPWTILGGWLCALFIPKFWQAALLALGLGAVCGYLIYLETLENQIPNDVSLATIVVILTPMTAAFIWLAWPIGALARLFLRRKKSTGA